MDTRPITIGSQRINELHFDDAYGQGLSDPYEPVLTAVIERYCEPGTIALDIGANIGCTAILLAQVASEVHAYEALPSTCNILDHNAQLHGQGRITVHRFGLGDEPGDVKFTRRSFDRSGAFVDGSQVELHDHVSETGEIRVLDDLMDEFSGRVGFIKVDVEGFELHVLRGARRLLAEHRPTVVLEMNHYCLNVFQRMCVPDFLDELRDMFPSLVAIDRHTLNAVDLHDPSPAYFAVHEHITAYNYDTLVASPTPKPDLLDGPRPPSTVDPDATAEFGDDSFVRSAYRVVLQRDGDPAGVSHWTAFLADGGWRKQVVDGMHGSVEFETLGSEPLLTRLHRARVAWIRTLPPATNVLDIGGSSPDDPAGSMKEMGWSGTPDRLTIVDLPPDDQYHGRPVYSQARPYVTPWGGEVVYFHARAEDLAGSDILDGVRFDAAFMGQAIEHIEVDAVPGLLRWIREHLAEDGWLAFDTPNRAITILQTPESFSDPDHKNEYRVPDFEAMLIGAGFRVQSGAGIMPCPASLAESRWLPLDTYDQPLVNDQPETGWALALVAVPA